jgi:hypothetical protein
MLFTFEEDFEPTTEEMAAAPRHNNWVSLLLLRKRWSSCRGADGHSEYDVSLIPKAGAVNESYVLSILSDSDTATISAVSFLGVIYALQSFNQLFYTHTNGQIYTSHAPVYIADEPKFKHRGLNMDLSRHFYPKESVLRVIDTISWQKFNRFHMHITDSQSWPLEIPSIPELATKGAYGQGLWYTAADSEEMLEYAAARGIIQAYIENWHAGTYQLHFVFASGYMLRISQTQSIF